ncbi:RloB family protein [Mucilaginibacter sp. AK015]|uniref:RloB family protein n=1 Tax=Mucilaginibacter sp. AK015 TaxID=2723072 RepID=UPI0016111AB7|nr:RloB family protein [Mucilaginibacter sp. AK015]MBB5395324.1 hypothetical protein [Mucilaginibacter sp. AK015]
MARNSGHRRGTGRTTFSIVVDGETELWYFQMLRKNESLPTISVQPELPRKKKLAEQFDLVYANANSYDHSIWIVDLDVVLMENATDELHGYMDKVRGNEKIHILINTPCLEFWFLQHFSRTGRFYAQCQHVGNALKRHAVINAYEKSERYFVRTNPDIYRRLRPYLQTGIANSEALGQYDRQNPQIAKSELYQVFQLLGVTV